MGVSHLMSFNWVSGTLHTFPLSLVHSAQGTITVSLWGEVPEHSGGAGHSSSHGSAGCHCSEADRTGRPPLWTAARAVLLSSLCSRSPPTSTFLSPFLHPQARDVYEEAIRTVMTVRDFTQVFDSYAQFEESMIAAKMETASELGREEEGELPGAVLGWGGEKARLAGRAPRVLSGRGKGEVRGRGRQGGRTAEWPGWVEPWRVSRTGGCISGRGGQWGESAKPRALGGGWGVEVAVCRGPDFCAPALITEPDDVDLELRLARFEQLIGRRPLLLNSVLLRQNPHHVHEWHKRVALHQGRPREVRDGPAPRRPPPTCQGPSCPA